MEWFFWHHQCHEINDTQSNSKSTMCTQYMDGQKKQQQQLQHCDIVLWYLISVIIYKSYSNERPEREKQNKARTKTQKPQAATVAIVSLFKLNGQQNKMKLVKQRENEGGNSTYTQFNWIIIN